MMNQPVISKHVLPRVAHIKSPYLPASETFLYGYMSNLKRYETVVIAEYAINQDLFPVQHLITHRDSDRWYERYLKLLRDWLVGRVPRELFLARFYSRAIRKSGAQVAHIHFGVPGMLLAPTIRRARIPALVSFYGYDLSQVPRALGEDIYRRSRLFESMEAFTVEGGNARRRLIELGCHKEKVHVVHIGVDLERFSFAPRTLDAGERPRILFCGRFVEKKGLSYALHALSNVHRAGHDFEFIVIGDGPQQSQVERLVDDLGLRDSVRFLGLVSHREFSKWCHRCHLLLAPSITDHKTGETEGGAPTVVLEGQATGLPVVATLHADIPEVVQNGKSGLLSAERDVDGLTHNLVELLQNSHRWPMMGKNGRAHVEAEYDIHTQTGLLETLYDRLRRA